MTIGNFRYSFTILTQAQKGHWLCARSPVPPCVDRFDKLSKNGNLSPFVIEMYCSA